MKEIKKNQIEKTNLHVTELGISSPEEFEENIKFYNSKVSSKFWLELKVGTLT